MDGTALSAVIISAAISATVTYSVLRRQWWRASGTAAMGSAVLLNLVTEGNQSHSEHKAVFAATITLFAFFAIAAFADARARRRGFGTKRSPTG